MADRMMFAVCCCAGLLASAVPAVGADLPDPTRPPAGFSEQASDQVVVEPPAPPLLVSSLFLLGDKPYALVDGVIVRPGDPLADGNVAKIDATGVWIRTPGAGKTRSGLRLLKWLPNVAKTPASKPLDSRMESK